MKIKTSVKPVCKYCKVTRRRGRLVNICSDPQAGGRHKQRQG